MKVNSILVIISMGFTLPVSAGRTHAKPPETITLRELSVSHALSGRGAAELISFGEMRW